MAPHPGPWLPIGLRLLPILRGRNYDQWKTEGQLCHQHGWTGRGRSPGHPVTWGYGGAGEVGFSALNL